MKKNRLLLYITLLCSSILLAQGDGPRNLLWGPKGATAFIPKWMSLDQNITPGNVLITDTDIDINVFPLTLVHNINIGGKFAQVMLNAVPGNASGIITDTQGVPIPNASASGFADGFIGLKYGLINTPSLNAIEFSQHQQKFSMYFYSRVWYSGTYDEKKPLNLGTNRFTFDFGPVMNLQFSKNSKRPTTLESYLGVHLYTANNSPSIGTFADKSQQLPSLVWENHFSHNFSNKLWGAATLRYQYGGALELDGINQDNKMNILGGGLTLGYQVMPLLAIHTSYGGIITGDNGAQSNMFRVVAMFTYVNLKKLKKQSN